MNYKLVPKQLTDSMAKVLRNEHCVYQTEQELYDALLEAAPAAPVELEPVAYMASSGTCITAEDVSYTPNWTDYYTTPLVRQADAAAVIAKLTQERDEATRKYSESVGGFKRDLQEKLDQQRDKNKRLREQLAAKDAEISELQQNVQTTADALGHAHLELAAMKGEEA